MTKNQKDAKMKEMQQWVESGVPKEAKDPSSSKDSFQTDVTAMKQREKQLKKSLEVVNGNETKTILSEASIKAIPGGYYEINIEKDGKDRE